MTAERRQQMGELVERVMREVGYTSAGTLEFLMDRDKQLYFIEANTRIQVEHPVTEMVTGIDLVKSQILLAVGLPLSEIVRDQVTLRGHSIECRINAEDPVRFMPSVGKVQTFHVPGGTGIRVDSACYSECVIHPYYDSLLAKLVVHGRNRREAISRMRRALEMFIVEGINTTIPLHRKIMEEPDFLQGEYDVRFLEQHPPQRVLVAQ
jgi:acetyl-CoA carboxylase biotin carboxylase subunit